MLTTIGIVALCIPAWVALGVLNYVGYAKLTGDPVPRMPREERAHYTNNASFVALMGPVGTIVLAFGALVEGADQLFAHLGSRFCRK